MSKVFHPMLAQDSTEIVAKDGKVDIDSKYFGNKDYILEIKFDGARYILQWDDEGKVHFTSRHISVATGLPTDKTENLRGYLFEDCPAMAGTVLDGEIIVAQKCGEDADGKPLWKITGENGSSETNRIMLSHPDKAKERLENPEIKVIYVVYDILQYQKPIPEVNTDASGKVIPTGRIKTIEVTDVTSEPLRLRKAYLENALIKIDNDPIMQKYQKRFMYSMNFKNSTHEEGKAQFEALVRDGHEGCMLKHINSPYEQGDHSKYWQKVKKMLTEDGVVMGMNTGTGKYKDTLGALVIGQWFELEGKGKEYAEVEKVAVDKEVAEHDIFAHEGASYFWRFRTYELPNAQISINGEQMGDSKRMVVEVKCIYKLNEVCTISGMTDEQRNEYSDGFMERVKLGQCSLEGTKVRFYPHNIRDFSWVVEFLAQEKTKAKYRHPRFLQNRDDKNIWDCTF